MNFIPIIYAFILFLLIRLVNDIPNGENYLAHSWQFIAIELCGVLASCFLNCFLAKKWSIVCVKRSMNATMEFAPVIFLPIAQALMVMSLSHDVRLQTEIPSLIIPVVISAMMSLWIYLSLKYQYMNELYAKAKIDEQIARNITTEVELRLLRSQVNPHFLFNMLNTLYFTIEESNEQARDLVEHLSNILRASLYENDSEVSVGREIETLESFIKLYVLRFGDLVNVSVDMDRRFGYDKIHPFLLLPLVENAFKHIGGNIPKVEINLRREPSVIEFCIENTISEPAVETVGASGLGLANLKRRLELLYPGSYEFYTNTTNESYKAYLKIFLK